MQIRQPPAAVRPGSVIERSLDRVAGFGRPLRLQVRFRQQGEEPGVQDRGPDPCETLHDVCDVRGTLFRTALHGRRRHLVDAGKQLEKDHPAFGRQVQKFLGPASGSLGLSS